jgi:hypothetical protein
MSPAGWPAGGSGGLCMGSVSLGIGVFAFTGNYPPPSAAALVSQGADEVESGIGRT